MTASAQSSTILDGATTALLARAERRVPARDASQEIDAQRMRSQLAYGFALSYEVVCDVQKGFAPFVNTVAPRLVSYMGQKRLQPFQAKGVFLSLFVGDWLYFIEAPRFLEAVREAEHLSEAAFRQKVAAWERGS